jgi:hypothetical protein
VFGQLKSNNKFNRFTFKGLVKVEMEFLLMAIGHNFRKMMAKKEVSVKISSKTKVIGYLYHIQIKIYLKRTNHNCFFINKNQNYLTRKLVA